MNRGARRGGLGARRDAVTGARRDALTGARRDAATGARRDCLIGHRREALIEEIRRRAPDGPGVYLFRGDHDEVLYVGKAVDLRERMLSHLRLDPLADLPRHSRLVFEVRDFDFQATASELLALLLEDEMIKRHTPRFNVRQNEFLEYKYLELTADEYPRLRMVDHALDFGDRRVFGPYRDRYLVDDLLGLIHVHLGLRSCSAADPVDRCLEFDLGHCSGPCRNAISPRDYEQVVARAVAFLGGAVSEVASRLQRAMESSSERLEYEKAQGFKECVEFCRRFGERQRFLAAFRERKLVVVEQDGLEGDRGRMYVFRRGRLTCHGRANVASGDTAEARAASVESAEPCESTVDPAEPCESTVDPAEVSESTSGLDPRFLYDRAAIVHGWLRRNSGRCRYSFT